MNTTAENLILQANKLPPPQKREILARLWSADELSETGKIWKSLRFSDKLRVVAYTPEQEPLIEDLRELLLKGALARIENEEEGTCEIYGADRTFYAVVSSQREFVGLLSSWLPSKPPKEIQLEEVR